MTGFVLKLVPDDEMRAILADIIHRLARIEDNMATELEAIQALDAKVSELGAEVEALFAAVDTAINDLKNTSDVSDEVLAVVANLEAQRQAIVDRRVAISAAP